MSFSSKEIQALISQYSQLNKERSIIYNNQKRLKESIAAEIKELNTNKAFASSVCDDLRREILRAPKNVNTMSLIGKVDAYIRTRESVNECKDEELYYGGDISTSLDKLKISNGLKRFFASRQTKDSAIIAFNKLSKYKDKYKSTIDMAQYKFDEQKHVSSNDAFLTFESDILAYKIAALECAELGVPGNIEEIEKLVGRFRSTENNLKNAKIKSESLFDTIEDRVKNKSKELL